MAEAKICDHCTHARGTGTGWIRITGGYRRDADLCSWECADSWTAQVVQDRRQQADDEAILCARYAEPPASSA